MSDKNKQEDLVNDWMASKLSFTLLPATNGDPLQCDLVVHWEGKEAERHLNKTLPFGLKFVDGELVHEED